MKHNYSFRRTLSVLVLFLTSALTWAWADFEADGIYYSILDEESVEVTYGSYSGDVVIPPSVAIEGKTYSVTSIGDFAFNGSYSLTSISIPDGVTNIGNYAFDSCYSLTSINLPGSVASIGEVAFVRCSSITSMTVSEDNPIYDSRGGCNAIIETASNTLISGCTNTIIPDGVTSIGDFAFSYYHFLTPIDIPGSVTNIGNYAFSYSSLTSIDIPGSVTSIGDGIFLWTSSLTAITVSEDNPVYDSRGGCNAIIETASNTLIAGCKNTVIPDNVTSIGNDVFEGCSGLTSINIPDGVTSIKNNALSDCRSLASIVLPSSVTSIGRFAFANCSSLTSVEIGNGATSIGEYAFSYCYSLTTVICRAENVPETGSNVFDGIPTSRATLYVPESAIEAYKEADRWKDFGTILPIEGNEDIIDGIDSPEALQDKATNTPYYTLDGKPAASPTRKGIYVKDGRKVMLR